MAEVYESSDHGQLGFDHSRKSSVNIPEDDVVLGQWRTRLYDLGRTEATQQRG